MRTTLITGANRGIGLELARQLSARGDRVIAVVRQGNPELSQLSIQVEAGIDVADHTSIRALTERLQGTRLDVLINNAGILSMDSLDNLDIDGIRRQFEVNALAPLRVTHALRSCLHEGSKVAIVTSRMGSLSDNTSGGMYGYRMSKAAVNMAGISLAKDLAPRGIMVALLHPGYVRTDMTDGHGNIDPSQAAKGLIQRIDALDLSTSGQFWHANGETLPW